MSTRIITQDQKNNILVGSLQVKDEKGLSQVRDFLMKSKRDLKHYRREIEQAYGFRSLLTEGYSKEGKKLVHCETGDGYKDECEYTKERFELKYLNSILIFTSLLNELDASIYDEIAKEFISQGIIKVAPLKKIWTPCAEDMATIKTEKDIAIKLADLKAFRAALNSGLITYKIEEKYNKDSQQGHYLLKGKVPEKLQNIAINNTLLLEDNRYLALQRKHLKK